MKSQLAVDALTSAVGRRGPPGRPGRGHRVRGPWRPGTGEYTPQPFTDTSVQTITTVRTRESVAETGWAIIPTDLTTPEPDAPPTAPNGVYYESLSHSAQAEYEVALQGQVHEGASSEMAVEDMACWGRANAQQQKTSPWSIDGFESLQAEMQGRW